MQICFHLASKYKEFNQLFSSQSPGHKRLQETLANTKKYNTDKELESLKEILQQKNMIDHEL